MARRPYWKGHIRLSLVSFAVQLYSAIDSSEKTTLHQIHKPTGSRIRYQKVVPEIGPVDTDEIVKGFEHSKGEYVLIEDDDLKALKLESRHTIELVQFVGKDEIDPIYYERPYFVVPEKGLGEEAFRIVRDALKKEGKVALGQIVLAGRERLGTLRGCGRGMIFETIRYEEELHEAEELFSGVKDEVSADEPMQLALQLIKAKTAPFAPEKFHDHYDAALKELVAAKLAGREPEPERAQAPSNVIDLTEALRRSLGGGAAKAAAAEPEPAKAPIKPKAAAKGKAKPAEAKPKSPGRRGKAA